MGDDGSADGTVMHSGPHKGKTFGTIVRTHLDYVKESLAASLGDGESIHDWLVRRLYGILQAEPTLAVIEKVLTCTKASQVEAYLSKLAPQGTSSKTISKLSHEACSRRDWLEYLQKRYALVRHANGDEVVIPADTTIMQFGKHRGKSFKEITDIDPEYIEFSLVSMDNKKTITAHPQCADWLKYLQGWYELRREEDTELEDGTVLANYVVDPIEVATASMSVARLSQTQSEGSLRATKLERRRLKDLEKRGRADQAEFVRRAVLAEKKREEAWFSSHGIHF